MSGFQVSVAPELAQRLTLNELTGTIGSQIREKEVPLLAREEPLIGCQTCCNHLKPGLTVLIALPIELPRLNAINTAKRNKM